MQTFHHNMAHRGSTATRTNARWHPYTTPRPSGSFSAGAVPTSCNHTAILSQSVSQQNIGYLLTPGPAVHHLPSQYTSSQTPFSISISQKTQQQSTLATTASKTHSARTSSDQSFVAILLGKQDSTGRTTCHAFFNQSSYIGKLSKNLTFLSIQNKPSKA